MLNTHFISHFIEYLGAILDLPFKAFFLCRISVLLCANGAENARKGFHIAVNAIVNVQDMSFGFTTKLMLLHEKKPR